MRCCLQDEHVQEIAQWIVNQSHSAGGTLHVVYPDEYDLATMRIKDKQVYEGRVEVIFLPGIF